MLYASVAFLHVRLPCFCKLFQQCLHNVPGSEFGSKLEGQSEDEGEGGDEDEGEGEGEGG